MKTINKIISRFKRDFIYRNHFDHYRDNLVYLKDSGYQFETISSAHKKINHSRIDKLVCIRHDVDIEDFEGNEIFYEIEKSLNIKSSFYFRLSTIQIHKNLINKLLRDGFEVGYHFEEPSTFMKENKIKDLNTLMKNSTTIQKKININIKIFESRINKKILSICAHGDWINRKYQFTNSIFVDKNILLKNSLLLEAYDKHFIKKFDCYITDTGNSKYIWKNNFSPINASQKKMNKLYILSHERTFHLNYFASWKSNLVAAYEKIIY